MPELPEVETTCRGIAPLLRGRRVTSVVVRQPRLRWPVPPALAREMPGQPVCGVSRRAKFVLVETPAGHLILHLGMSGSLRIVPRELPPEKHDHLDVIMDDGRCLRLRDPRRFGAALWTTEDPLQHRLLKHLGPEPLENEFNAEWLHRLSRRRRVAVKSFLMNSHVVAGVGNIYASEALFLAGILPGISAGRISLKRYQRLVDAVREVLEDAIAAGGTTLRDFVGSDGSPGYFSQKLRVYGRHDEACEQCGSPVRSRVIGQRSTFYCTRCQH
ncbi:MAG: bifunctional DNA-formamidopyrimidine glycosylase/DNA-(apurinic or apyrimidinic site) lyase [Gammaproteobacteria bacterium]|nr:MAG: bifunctional DNA-formamidopyrimidine glycosylase/DNA-(apurinic or apyrimidinic site) lyase [Gammaproteobacteria bacterium]